MPLRCISTLGEDVFAFQFDEQSWSALQIKNKSLRHLRMQCCGANVVLKKSSLGTRFFAHARRGGCETAPESVEHLLAKQHIVEAIQNAGWVAMPEQRGQSPEGRAWIADVLAQLNNKKVAFEVQWSPQTEDETFRRQNIYKESVVRGLWLLKQIQIPVSKAVPAFRLRLNKPNNSFEVLIPSSFYRAGFINQNDKDHSRYWQQIIPLKEFVSGALSKKLQFAPTIGMTLPVNVYAAACLCWKCKKETNIILKIEFNSSSILKEHPNLSTNIYAFDSDGGLPIINKMLPNDKLANYKVGHIKLRSSKTLGQKYLSNGCFHCDALQGQFFEHEVYWEQKLIFSSEVQLTQSLVDMLAEEHSSIYCWWFNRES